jgi:hypothetical protein
LRFPCHLFELKSSRKAVEVSIGFEQKPRHGGCGKSLELTANDPKNGAARGGGHDLERKPTCLPHLERPSNPGDPLHESGRERSDAELGPCPERWQLDPNSSRKAILPSTQIRTALPVASKQ